LDSYRDKNAESFCFPHFHPETTPNFQAKHAKYSNFRIIKIAAAIPIKFCTLIDLQVLPVGGPNIALHKSKEVDGRHLEKC